MNDIINECLWPLVIAFVLLLAMLCVMGWWEFLASRRRKSRND